MSDLGQRSENDLDPLTVDTNFFSSRIFKKYSIIAFSLIKSQKERYLTVMLNNSRLTQGYLLNKFNSTWVLMSYTFLNPTTR